jgi:hypothetical protein
MCQMGKLSNSWELIKQSFQVLMADTELMWLPVLSAISCVLVTTVVALGGGAFFYPSIKPIIDAGGRWEPSQGLLFGACFVFYLVNYFVIVFFNTALVGAATIRLQGGDPTLRDGLQLAWARKWVIFQWAFLAATVGMILKMIEGRSSLVGKLVAGLIGLAWTLASFLVVPILAFEELSPFEALSRSAELFRKTWGEQVVGGFSFGLIFFLLTLPGLLMPLVGHVLGGQAGLIIGIGWFVIYILLISVVNSATHGIFVAALYRYATTGDVAPGFSSHNLTSAWRPKGY